MIPPKVQNLSSSTIALNRRSYHWTFDGEEFDLSIDAKSIFFDFKLKNSHHTMRIDDMWCRHNNYLRCNTPIEYIQNRWLQTDQHSMKLLSWFDGTEPILNFILNEYNEMTQQTGKVV